MKSLSIFSRTTAFFMGLALAMFVSSSHAANNTQTIQGGAQVVKVRGDATFTEPNAKPLPVIVGLVLKPGTIITTGSRSSVELDLAENGKKLVLIENTVLEIKELEIRKSDAGTDTTTKLDLKKGGLYGNVKKISQASSFDVTYAKGVAGIRGTEWAILPDGTVVCTSGSVEVTFQGPNGVVKVTLDASNGPVKVPPGGSTPVPASTSDLPADGKNQGELVVGSGPKEVIVHVSPTN